MSVFIAYSREDRHLAEWLAASLKAQNFDVLPRRPAKLNRSTMSAMRRAKANIFLWTPEAEKNEAMQKIARFAVIESNYIPLQIDVMPGAAKPGDPHVKISANVRDLEARLRALKVDPVSFDPGFLIVMIFLFVVLPLAIVAIW